MQAAPTPHRRLYAQGVVVNVLNPKTALFFLAFLPQFVDASSGSVPAQVAFLGVLFAAIALTTDTMYALLADLLAGKLRRSGTGAKLRRWVSGGIFIALGVTAAAAHRRRRDAGSRCSPTRGSSSPRPGTSDVVLRPPPAARVARGRRPRCCDAFAFPLAGEPLAKLVQTGGTATIVIEQPALPIPAVTRRPRHIAIAAVADELDRLGVEAGHDPRRGRPARAGRRRGRSGSSFRRSSDAGSRDA